MCTDQNVLGAPHSSFTIKELRHVDKILVACHIYKNIPDSVLVVEFVEHVAELLPRRWHCYDSHWNSPRPHFRVVPEH